jgi:hypothetical protein
VSVIFCFMPISPTLAYPGPMTDFPLGKMEVGRQEPFPKDLPTPNQGSRHSYPAWHHRSEPRLKGEQWIQQPVPPRVIISLDLL